MSSNDLVAIIGLSVIFAGVASLLWEGWQLRRDEAREIERNMRNAGRARSSAAN